MKHRLILSIIGILLTLNIAACQNTTTPQAKETTAPTQTPVTSAKRVVALTSLSADIIYQLDKSKLVGITGSSLLNKNPNFKDITRVSEGQTPPNLEKIVALKPDLVIGAEGFSNQTIEKVKQLGIPTLLTRVNDFEALEALTKNLAQTINADPQPLLKRYQTFVDTNIKPNASTLVLASRQPILSPNKSSWAGNLLEKFNVKNVTADLQGKSPIRGYITLSPEKILETNPNTIILVTPPQGGSQQSILESFKQESFWGKLEATKNNRVYVFDYYGFVNAGTIDAIEKACKQLKDVLS
ncbi:ABC transporter iron binding protein [Calothrix sp. PCC 7716]|nr:ABC transporter iron binding protein [Calothrix sp. PCC 7716]